jgi:tetratricopeptide (TPR) repeat protein
VTLLKVSFVLLLPVLANDFDTRSLRQIFRNTAIFALWLTAAVGFAQSQAGPIRSLIVQGKLAEADHQIQQLLNRNPHDAQALNLQGELRRKQRKFLAAEQSFRAALDANPKSAPALENLGRLLADEQRTGEAISVYEKLPTAARTPKLITELAALYQQSGDYEKSLQLAHSVPAASRPDKLLPIIAADYIGLHNDQETQRSLDDVMRRAMNPELVPQLATVLLKNNMVGDAAQLLKLAEQHQKPTPAFLAVKAQVQARSGHREEAKNTVQEALAADPNLAEGLWVAARLAANDNDMRSAFKNLKRMWEQVPPRPEMLQFLIYTAMQVGDLQTAHDAAYDWQKIQPDSLDSALAMSAVLIQGLHYGDAEHLLEPLLRKYPSDKRVLFAMGAAQFSLGKLDDAEKNLTASLGLGSGDAETHYKLGLIAKQRGDLERATREMEASIAGDPRKADALTALGQLYLHANNTVKAREVLEQAVQAAPADAQSHYQLAMTYRRLGMADQAREQMQEFEKLSARHVPDSGDKAQTIPH